MKFDIDKRVTIYSTAWKVSKYGLISGPYFPVFSPNVMDPFSDPIQQCSDFLGEHWKQKKQSWIFSGNVESYNMMSCDKFANFTVYLYFLF